MKSFLHYLNTTLAITTALLALIYGEKALTAFLLLGAFQLITAFIISVILSYKRQAFKEIIVYWILIFIYFIIIINLISNEEIKLLFIPIIIAIYHCYMTFKLKKS
ncbi:MAG: hypothetical protein RL427_824 [Bacteroidota bacterium]|jgi:hypothetical protein